ncbi:hypothetical protein IQ255_10805 [Pleurocapsales cyanobacterium LEGE 10410]|nr:hypothetical protein [Pleurocapsales cyanobacterium LEGE 10410]
MEIAENTVLATAVVWVVWQVLSLRDMALNGGAIIPPAITSLIIFTVFLALVVAFQVSSLHLIWLFLLSLVLGFVAIIFPLGQKIAMGFLGILAMTGKGQEETEE